MGLSAPASLSRAQPPPQQELTVIDFEDLTTTGPGQGGQVSVDRQYETRGVVFNSPRALDYTKGLGAPGFPHSGSNAIEHCYAVEFCTTSFMIQFTRPQAHVKLWVGYSQALNQTQVVVLRAFDQTGALVGITQITLPASQTGHPIRTPLEMSLDQPGIIAAEVGFAAGDAFTAGLAVDDLEFGVDLPLTVPNVIGLHSDSARMVAARAGFSLVVVGRRLSPEAPETVIEQEPRPGRLVGGRPDRIRVTIAIPQPVQVPDLIGMSVERATELLRRRGFALGGVTNRASTQPLRTVIDQDPAPGTEVPAGAGVSIAISDPQLVRVPDLLGRTLEEAERILRQTRLGIGDAVRRPSERPPETVIDQSPSAGSTIRPGGTVSLVLAVPEPVRVPMLIGIPLERARGVLSQARLALGQVDPRASTDSLGFVIEQRPEANTLISVGDTVSVVISDPQMVRVPDLRGLSLELAIRRLSANGLERGSRNERPSDRSSGSIVEHTPSAGDLVERGSAVDVVIATPLPVTVPDVTGMTLEQAQESVTGRGLRLGSINRDPLTGSREPVVASQIPVGGTQVAPNSPVDLVMAVPEGVVATRVHVPDLAGHTVEEARRRLEPLGLRLAFAPGHTWEDSTHQRIASQEPQAGVFIDAGGVILVAPLAPEGRIPWILVIGGVTVLSLLALGVHTVQKRHGEKRKLEARVTVRTTSPPFSAVVTAPSRPIETEIRLRLRRGDVESHVSAISQERIISTTRRIPEPEE